MTISEIVPIIMAVTDEEKKNVGVMLSSSGIKDIGIIDISCVYKKGEYFKQTLFHRLKLLKCPKIFHGNDKGMKDFFDSMVKTFNQQEKKDFIYKEKLKNSDIVISYWKHHYEEISTLVSKDEGTMNEEI